MSRRVENIAASSTNNRDSWRLIGRLSKASYKHLHLLILSFLSMAVIAAMSAAYTYLMGPFVDRVLIARESSILLLLGGAVIVIFVMRSLARYAQEVLLVTLGQKIVLETQNRLFSHVIRQDVGLFRSVTAGALVGHFTYDVNLLRVSICNFFLVVGKDTLTVVSMVGLMFHSNWVMAIYSLMLAPLCIIPIIYVGNRLRAISIETQARIGELTAVLTQAFQGARVVQAYRLERLQLRRVVSVAASLRSLMTRKTQVEAAVLPIFDALGGIAVAGIIVYGGTQVIGQTMTAGELLVFTGAVYGAYQPMRSLSRVSVTLQTGLAAAQRIFALIDRRSAVSHAPKMRVLPRESGAVAFEGVRFAYEGRAEALNGLDLVAPAGAITALVGRSGAGKSTALSLISRFYDPDAGRVLVNGADVRAVCLASLRDCIALVSQDVTLFDDTIANNIRYGRLDASDAEVRQAAEAACCAFVLRLPDGFETRVGEQGARLSGGERQRIAVARAILKDAPILLLDEATSAQDAESERQIQDAVARLMRGRTTIVIAQRLATIRNADVIHVIDAGRVAESGDHDALLARRGLYAHLHALQFPEIKAALLESLDGLLEKADVV